MAHYGRVEYWNTRYHSTRVVEPFHEWYQSYATLRHFLTTDFLSPPLTPALKPSSSSSYNSYMPNAAASVNQHQPSPPQPTFPFPHRSVCRTLILGCGNSRFGEDMLRDGWTGGIVNVDFSPVVIEQMKARYNDAFYQQLGRTATTKSGNNKTKINNNNLVPRMEFVCADITKGLTGTHFRDGSFDLIICKATLDAILSSSGSVSNAKVVIQECQRLLKDNHGVLMLVTFGNPDCRVAFLEHEGDLSYYWQGVSVHVVPRTISTKHAAHERSTLVKKDYVYMCRKRIHPATIEEHAAAAIGEENQPTVVAASHKRTNSTNRFGC